MIFLMPDACIWISFLEQPDLRGPLKALEGLVAENIVELWTTEEIQHEVRYDKRGKARKADAEKLLLDKILDRVDAATDKELAEAAEKIKGSPRLYDRADDIEEAMGHVDDLLQRSRVIAGSEAVSARVLHRIAKGLAPFHRLKGDVRQSFNDGIIIEKFASAAAELDDKEDACVFISINNTEFATATNSHQSHADFSNIFGDRCIFMRNISRAVDELREMANLGQIARKFSHSDRKSWNEISAEIAVVGDHDWFHRHLARKEEIADGTCSLKPGRSVLIPLRPPRIGVESWRDELVTAERKLAGNPGLPITTDPYQSGFAAGALMALRWVRGEAQSPAHAMTRTPPEGVDVDETPRELRSA